MKLTPLLLLLSVMCLASNSCTVQAQEKKPAQERKTSAAEKTALRNMFVALGSMVTVSDDASESDKKQAVADFIRSIGQVATTGAKKNEGGEISLRLERFFDALGKIIESNHKDPKSKETKKAVGELMRSIFSFAEADPDSKLGSKQQAALKDMLDAIVQLIENSVDGADQAVNRKLIQNIIEAVGEAADADLKLNLDLDTPSGPIRVKDSQILD